jgi:hypothetical protein
MCALVRRCCRNTGDAQVFPTGAGKTLLRIWFPRLEIGCDVLFVTNLSTLGRGPGLLIGVEPVLGKIYFPIEQIDPFPWRGNLFDDETRITSRM